VDALREAKVRRSALFTLAGVAAIGAAVASTRFTASAIVFAQLAVFLMLLAWRPRLACVAPLLLIFEMWRPAARAIEWFPPRPVPSMRAPRWPDQRRVTTSPDMLNQMTAWQVEDAWGYDPAAPARWTDLIGPLLGADARRGDFAPTRDLAETRNHPIWRMIRVDNGDALPLPRVLLIDDVRRVSSPEESLAAVREAGFDPARVVIVEAGEDELRPYGIVRGDGPIGDVTVVRQTADSLEILADVSRGAILLVTDAYSAGWRVRPFDPGPQSIYAMPANHALRAVPLAAGKHHFIMEYRPRSIAVGLWISGIGAVLTILLIVAPWLAKRRASARRP
jgi:hypothetical protein